MRGTGSCTLLQEQCKVRPTTRAFSAAKEDMTELQRGKRRAVAVPSICCTTGCKVKHTGTWLPGDILV